MDLGITSHSSGWLTAPADFYHYEENNKKEKSLVLMNRLQ
jgi:hypothetical protein